MKYKIIYGVKVSILATLVFVLYGFSDSKEFESIPAKVLEKISIPKWYHEGLYFDGTNIWVNNGQKGKTWVIDTSDGSIIRQIEPVGTFTESVTSRDKGVYFVTDWDTKKIYSARITDNRMIAETETSVAPAHPTGIAWTGANLFVITWTRTLTGTKFHLLKMDEKFNILSKSRIKNIAEPAHMAWDGKNLWIACWFSKQIYKLDAEAAKFLGYFRSPATRTTGIAWDGNYFWVTGTYSDLYKVEINN